MHDSDLEPNYFFPGSEVSERAIAPYCTDCEVKLDCLEWAVANHEPHGVWGSTTTRERERIRSFLRARLAENAEVKKPLSNGFEASHAVRALLVEYLENKLQQSRPKRSRTRTRASASAANS